MKLNEADEKRIARWELILKLTNTPLRLIEICRGLDKIRDEIKHDMDAMIKYEYFHITKQMTKSGVITYYQAKQSYVDRTRYTAVRKTQQENAVARLMSNQAGKKTINIEPTVKGARLIKLTNETYWTPKAKQHMEVRRGCTLSGI